MKKYYLMILVLSSTFASGQILQRNFEGEPLFSPRYDAITPNTLINFNTGTQSIALDYLFNTKANNPSKYKIYRLGVSVKPSEGVGPLMTNGQFSPGVKLSGSMTKIPFLAKSLVTKGFDDWISFNLAFNYEKNKLFRNDPVFSKQLYDTSFTGISLGTDYTMVFGEEEQDYLNIRLTYNRKSSAGDLTAIDVEDNRSFTDPATGVTRTLSKKQSAREGTYTEFDAWNWQIAYTRLPKYQFKYIKNARGGDSARKKQDISTSLIPIPAGTDTITRVVTEYIMTNGVMDSTTRFTKEIVSRPARVDTVITITSKTEPVGNPLFKSVKIGYSLYFNSTARKGEYPNSKIGGVVFFISPNKEDVLVPRIGITFQFNDPFDVKGANTGVFKRLQAGLTTTFSL
jgi:hypothetical protein